MPRAEERSRNLSLVEARSFTEAQRTFLTASPNLARSGRHEVASTRRGVQARPETYYQARLRSRTSRPDRAGPAGGTRTARVCAPPSAQRRVERTLGVPHRAGLAVDLQILGK